MMSRSPCQHERIDRFLSDRLGEHEHTAFESHLEHCERCRQLLESRAAAPDEWSEVRDLLSDTLVDPLSESIDIDTPLALDAVLGLLAPTDDPHMLGRLGGYEIAGAIGSGGMGVVLKGFDRSLNRFVAIKVLAPHLATSHAARRRFSREAKAAAAVVHENVIAIHGVCETGSIPYLVMPYVRGLSLEKRIQQQGTLELVEILRIGWQTAAALDAAHAQGLVHRDVKPANILLEEGVERLTITDFGLARAADDSTLTRTGVIAGTPQYMSPEQARGEMVDGRSDLFSLGSVLYATCTGHSPFRAETSYGVIRKICDTPAPHVGESNPDIPSWLVRVIDRLLRKDPDDRFQSAADVARLLKQCLAHVQHPSVVPLPKSLFPSSFRRWRTWRYAMGTAAVLGGLVIAFALWRSAGSVPVQQPLKPAPQASRSGAAPRNEPLPADHPTEEADPLEGLDSDVGQFEEAVERFWGRSPLGEQLRAPANTSLEPSR